MVLSKNTSMWIIIAVALIVIILLFVFGSGIGNNSNVQNGTNNGPGMKFTDSPDYKSSFLISSETLDGPAQNAISGFSLSRIVMADGSINITLKALNPEYNDQNYIVKPGQNLYFIEKYGGDDSPPNNEGNLVDDKAILVDKDGYIVS